jgi:phosphatidylglycerol:prolipoprotein diacylglycerol transferase
MRPVLGTIPYTTFPQIDLGPVHLRTFGLMVGLGVLIGAWLAARRIERYGIRREDTYRLATRMVVCGVIGARITWDLTHLDQIDSPLDLIAVWQGGLQFSGGFIAAVAVGFPVFRQWRRALRWHVLDGYAFGLTVGLALGRVGCYPVGEHFGSASTWLLAVRYDGGSTREASLGDAPLVPGVSTFHNTALYEFGFLLLLALVLLVIRRRSAPGAVMGVFCLYYGIARGLTDFLRVNDDTVLGLTGAQYLCIVLIPTGLWILTRVAPSNAAAERDRAAAEADAEEEEASAGDGLGDDAGDGGDGPISSLSGADLVGPEQVRHDPEHPLHEGA